jgi:uncharacterized protein (TIGR03437 family)
MKYGLFCLMLGCLIVGFVRDETQTANRGAWVTLAPMPSSRQEVSTAVLEGKIYVIGGYDASGLDSHLVEVYDPQNNSWTSAAPLPIATNHNAAAIVAGKLYAFGGTSNRAFVYNRQSNSWSDVAPMIFQHGNTPAVGVINDKIYVAGGTGPGMNQNEVEVYDPAANRWTQLASMNVPRNHTAGGVINGKLYVAGGRGSASSANALEVYDPPNNTWTRLPNMPTGRSGIGAGVVNGEFYVFGGELPRLFSEVEVFNPLTNSWQSLPPMPTPRHGLFGSVIGNAIYLPAGATVQGFGATNVNEAYLVNTATTVSAASFTNSIAGKAIVAVFGEGLATMTQFATSLPLPTELGGTTIQVTDSTGTTRSAPMFFASPNQINYQIPPDTSIGPAFVTVTSSIGRVSTGAIQIISSAPALFTLSGDGQGTAAALDGFTYAGPPFNATRQNGEPNILAFFCTGFGADATDVDGNVNASVQVTIDGNPATALYAGRAPGLVGANQLNVLLPAGIGSGTHTLQVSRQNISSNIVRFDIR